MTIGGSFRPLDIVVASGGLSSCTSRGRGEKGGRRYWMLRALPLMVFIAAYKLVLQPISSLSYEVWRHDWSFSQGLKGYFRARCKCVFVHLQKTGGTTVENRLYSVAGVRLRGSCHDRPDEIEQGDPEAWESYFKFSLVRNPYAVLVSTFEYDRQFEGHQSWKDATEEGHQDLAKMGTSKHYEDFRRWLSSPEGRWGMHEHEMSHVLYGDEGELLVDQVVRLEELDQTWRDVVCKKARHLDCAAFPAPSRSTSHGFWGLYYDRESALLVQRELSKDFENFGYHIDSWRGEGGEGGGGGEHHLTAVRGGGGNAVP